MMKRAIISCALGSLLLGVTPAESMPAGKPAGQTKTSKASGKVQKNSPSSQSNDAAPARILKALAGSYDAKVGGHLGMRSSTDVAQTETDPPIRMAHVRLDSLKTYDGRTSANALVVELPRVTRLVRVNGQVCSSMVMRQENDSWQVVQMGEAKLAVAMDQVARQLIQTKGVTLSDLLLVKIPAMGLNFFAYKDSEALQLVPLFDTPAYGLRVGQSERAELVLGKLVEAAKKTPLTRVGR